MKIVQFLKTSITVGVTLMMALLTLSAFLVQTIIYVVRYEWADMISPRPWVYLCLLAFFPLSIIINKLLDHLTKKQLFILLAPLFSLGGLLLIALTTDITRDDAATVFRSAVHINQGSLSSLNEGAYLFRYPHQLGLVTFERIILTIIPIPSMVVFFLLNIFAILLTNAMTWKITELLFDDDHVSKWAIFLSFAFLPQFFNILFVYGIVYSLAIASVGIYFFIRYLSNHQRKDALVSLLTLATAYWIRNNNIILLITLSVIILLEAICQKNKRLICYPIVLFGLAISFNKATLSYYQHLAGHELKGTPKVAWLAMGLQDLKDNHRQPGWYTSYVRDIYFEKSGDYDQIKEDADKMVTHEMQKFFEKPAYAWTFFSTKFLTTWTESTFQSIWSGPSKPQKQPLNNIYAASIFNGRWGYRIIYQVTHAMLILIYLGAFLYLIFSKNMNLINLYPFIYLAGGIIFHLLWETKSQYASPYVYLLIPFVVKGWGEVYHFFKQKKNFKN